MKKSICFFIFFGALVVAFASAGAKENPPVEQEQVCFKFVEFPSSAVQHYNAAKGVKQIPSEELMVKVSCGEKGR